MSSAHRLLAVALAAATLWPGVASRAAEESGDARPVEAESLLGEPLRRPALPSEFRQHQEALLASARARLETEPADADAAIWVGRRLAYLGRYGEAIAVYTEALERHPESAALYRHRGHRFITTRRLEKAIDDLARAAELTRGLPDEVEPDGLPNALGIPTSTLQGNIHYHLGLAHYLQGDFEPALAAYRDALSTSTNPDMHVATSYWLYMTLVRLGRDEEAARVLAPIDPEMEVIENHDYHRLLLLFRGDLEATALWDESRQDDDSLASATLGYGLGSWYLMRGDFETARRILTNVLAGGQWAAFGYIAAEAEMARGSLDR